MYQPGMPPPEVPAALAPGAWWALRAVVVLAMLVLVPLGLSVLRERRPALGAVARWWWLPAVPAAVAQLLPDGGWAGLLCLPYLAATLALPALAEQPTRAPWALRAALLALPVAAVGMASERFGFMLFRFPVEVLALTAAHFHVAGFGALLLVALVGEPGGRAARAAGGLAIAGVVAVGAGFMIGIAREAAGDAVELAGAGLLAGGLWLAIGAALPRTRGRDRAAVAALGVLSLVTMGLALSWAAGHVLGWAHPSLTWMVLTHGVLNAAAVLTATVVAWLRTAPDWRTQRMVHDLGTGIDRFDAAAEALFRWDMHRGAGAHVARSTPDAVAGLRMVSRLGFGPFRLPEPCEVLHARREQTLEGGARASMRYRALPGHVFEGEEEFAVVIGPDARVRFEVDVTSRPAWALARCAAPVVPLAQRLFIARCARVLRGAPVVQAAR